MKTADLVSSFGVNTHYATANPVYRYATVVASELNYLGINSVRDALPDTTGQLGRDQSLAAYGVHFDLLFRATDDLATGISLVETLASRFPNAVSAIEGPNEIWNTPVTYNGLTGTAGAVALQEDLYGAVKSSATLSDIPVYNFTAWPVMVGDADFVNTHLYAGSQQLGTAIQTRIALVNQLTSGHGAVLTETGVFTTPDLSVTGSVSELAQAKLDLNALVDGISAGFDKVFLYELTDGAVDPTGSSRNDHYGLFDVNGNAKPAAVAIHNFITALNEHVSGTFSETPLTVTTVGLPSDAHVMTTQSSDDSYSIIAWEEQEVWDAQTKQDIVTTPHTVDVQFGQSFGTVEVYDPLVGSSPIATYADASSVSIAISDHPLVINVSDPLSAHGGFSAADRLISGGTTPGIFSGGLGHDYINGSSGADTILGGDGNDHLYGVGPNGGVDGADSISGGAGIDRIQGNAGADTLDGGDGDDRIYGGADNDLIFGGAGSDSINGNLGDDSLLGGLGNDYLRGGRGNDVLSGDGGNDTIQGDLGFDTMTGGSGSDLFVFGSSDATIAPGNGSMTSLDTILDFTPGEDHISIGYVPSQILQATPAEHYINAVIEAQQLLSQSSNYHAAVSVQVGNDTLLFYGDGSATTSVIDLQKFTASSVDTGFFA